MKKLLVLFTVLLFIISAIAQSPDSFKYQAVLRDAKGQIMASENVTIEITILLGSATGTTVFTETHHVTTTQQGIINLNIGSIEDMSSVDWSGNSHYIEVKVNGKLMGTSQLLSVPYALHAKTAETVPALSASQLSLEGTFLKIHLGNQIKEVDLGDMLGKELTKEILGQISQFTLEGNTLQLGSSGKTIDLTQYLDNTDQQTLNLENTTLSITNGNAVDLPVQKLEIENRAISITDGNTIELPEDEVNDADADPMNEIQYLSLENNVLQLSNADETIDLSIYLDNTDHQQLAIEQHTISISNGNTIILPEDKVNDADADPENELQHLTFKDNVLMISGTNETVNFSSLLDNTDKQTLTINGRTIEISNGNTIDLPEDKTEDADADPENEIQHIAHENNILSLSGTEEKVALNEYLDNTDNQELSLTNNQLSISNGNTIDLSGYASVSDLTNYSANIIDELNSKVDKIKGKGLSTKDFTSAEKTKLASITSGAEANVNADWNAISGDAEILNKPNSLSGYGISDAYTQTQADFLFSGKVDKITGRGLSAENFTTAEKTKLALIAESAEVNVNADWDAASGDAEILNKPDLNNYLDNTDDQILTLSGNSLEIEDGNSVDLSGYAEMPTNATTGDMSYYDGTSWKKVAAPASDNMVLTYCHGEPTWTEDGKCPIEIGDFNYGGVVFYIDGTGEHGLVCAVSDQSAGIRWNNGTNMWISAVDNEIGEGQNNTTKIVAAQGAGSYAAKLCDDLTENGYSDWFLPSRDELRHMYLNLDAINTTANANGGSSFSTGHYWSSTEYDTNYARRRYFPWGNIANENKFNTLRVRAVRAF